MKKKQGAVVTEFAVEQLEKTIFLKLIRGDFKAGDLLPSVERLSQTFGVSRPTVRAALGRLIARGLLTRHDGVGILVEELLAACEIDLLIRLIGSSPDARALELEAQLLDLLAVNIREVLARAAACRTDEHLTWYRHYFRQLLSRMDYDSHVDLVADSQYQMLRVLAAAAGSVAFTVLLNSFRSYLRGAGGVALISLEAWRQLEVALEAKDVLRCQLIVNRCFELRIQRVLELLASCHNATSAQSAGERETTPEADALDADPLIVVSDDEL